MASRRFKLKFTLPSFHFCRSKRPSSFSKCPTPAATYLFSPVNPKSFEISYPTFPDPPPSTPNHSSSKFISLNPQKIHNSPTSFDPDCKSPIKQSKSEIKENKKRNNSKTKTKSKSKSKVCASISSGDSVWFSSEDEKEIENTFSSSTSFDSSLETINESPSHEDRKNHSKSNKRNNKKNNNNANLRARRLRRYVSYSCRTVSSESEYDLPAKKSSVVPAAEGKVKESFAVVKRSEDPYEDFKRSMLEMILEKQMFEAKDLEQLLECFLSLNSKQHHEVIVQAFSEIWADLFL